MITTASGLKKPQDTDNADLLVFIGDNMDTIETLLAGKAASSHNHTLDGLSNVTITSKAAGHFLEWNGSAWINNALVAADIPNLDTGKITTGTLPVARGGTGLTSIATLLNTNNTIDSILTNGASTSKAMAVGRYLQYGTGVPTSNLGDPTVTEMALFNQQFTNKTWFYDISKISFEYTNDGTTWQALSVSDTDKRNFVAGNNSTTISIPNKCVQFRINIVNNGYVFLNALYMYWSSNSHSTKVTIDKKLNSSGAWSSHTSSTTGVSAWPGHLYLPFSTIAFSTSSSQYGEIRIIFTPTWSNDATYGTYPIHLNGMEIWGGYPTGSRHIYSWDGLRNVAFPAELKATTFRKSDGTEVSYSGHSHDFSALTNKPTTVSGYGITDAVSLNSPAFTGTPTAPNNPNIHFGSYQVANANYVHGVAQFFKENVQEYSDDLDYLWTTGSYFSTSVTDPRGYQETGIVDVVVFDDVNGYKRVVQYFTYISNEDYGAFFRGGIIDMSTSTPNWGGWSSLIPDTATTTTYGITKLSSATNSTSQYEAATPYAVKQALDSTVIRYNAIVKGVTWSRILQMSGSTTVGHTFILNVTGTRGNVVYNATFLVTCTHSSSANIVQLNNTGYGTTFQIRAVVNVDGIGYIEIYDSSASITNATTQTLEISINKIRNTTLTGYTAFTDGTTLPTGYTAQGQITTVPGSTLVGSLTGTGKVDINTTNGRLIIPVGANKYAT